MLLNIEGFDNGRAPGVSAGGAANGNTPGPIGTGRMGGKSYYLFSNSSSVSGSVSYWPPTAPALSDGAVGFAAKVEGGAQYTQAIVALRAGTTELVGIKRTAAGTLTVSINNGATQLVETVAINPAVWNHFDFRFTIAGAGGGKLQLAINDELVLDATGLTFTTVQPVSNVLVQTGTGVSFNKFVYLDDTYVTDTTGPAPYNDRLGDCKVELLRPTAQGAVAEWVGSDANSVDNWALIDDAGVTTDYIGSGTPGAVDLSQLADPTGTNLGVVYATQAEVMAAKSDAGAAPGDLQLVERSQAGTDQFTTVATPAQLSTTFQWFDGPVRVADPAGDPWTVDRLNNLQVGVKVAGP